jgi:hypothetical protein
VTTATQRMQLGDPVIFRNHDGLPETAIVCGTRDSINSQRAKSGGQVPQIEGADRMHLTVFPPSGGVEARFNVPPGSGPGTWSPRERDGPG